MQPLLDERQAAEILGVTVFWLRQRRGDNPKPDGPPYLKLGKLVKYRGSDLKEWLEAQAKPPPEKRTIIPLPEAKG